MPNKLNAKKALRQGKKKKVYNLRIKRGVKNAIKNTRIIIKDKPKDAEAEIRKAIKIIDKALQKGVLKKRNAARRKSRLYALHASKKSK